MLKTLIKMDITRHSVHRGMNPPSKTPSPSFLPSPAPLFLKIGYKVQPSQHKKKRGGVHTMPGSYSIEFSKNSATVKEPPVCQRDINDFMFYTVLCQLCELSIISLIINFPISASLIFKMIRNELF